MKGRTGWMSRRLWAMGGRDGSVAYRPVGYDGIEPDRKVTVDSDSTPGVRSTLLPEFPIAIRGSTVALSPSSFSSHFRAALRGIQPVPAFPRMAALKDAAVRGNVDDLDKLCSGKLECAPGGRVFRVAGDPDGIEPKLPGKREEQSYRTSREAMAPMRRRNVKANVAGIALDMRGGTDTQIDPPQFFSRFRTHHLEEISWHLVPLMYREIGELQLEIAVAQFAGNNRREKSGHATLRVQLRRPFQTRGSAPCGR